MTCHNHRRARRPDLIARAVHWRIELGIAVSSALLGHFTSFELVGVLGGTAGVLVATVPAIRGAAVQAYQLVALPHRVRKALAEAGAVDTNGNLPWVLYARSADPNVIWVEIKLRAGVTYDDLYFAMPNVRTACGAFDARAFLHAGRSDRARVILLKPRWGLFG